jgi:hypothetical protein
VDVIIAVMRAAGDRADGRRPRGLIVVLWRAGLRIQQTLALPRRVTACAGQVVPFDRRAATGLVGRP